MKFFNHKGNVLLFAIVAFTLISVLGTGIYFMTTSATFSGLAANAQNRAYQLAVAGRDYALAQNADSSYNGDYTMSNGDKFHLVIVGDTITSTGIVNENTPYEARRKITINKTGFGSQADVSFAKDIANFPSGIKESQTGYVNVDQITAQISLGQLRASQFGSVWYSGTSGLGNCQNGECDFGTGFRSYFMFKLSKDPAFPTDIPHGFTFAIFNGADNSNTSAGGDYTMPELLAYAGNSLKGNFPDIYVDPNPIVSQKGIQAPKMAIEFDGRQNCCDTPPCGICKPDFCNYAGDLNSNSRSDGLKSHMSYVFWGDNDITTACTNKENSLTYDDNKHGAPIDASDPVNSISTDTSDNLDYFIGSTPSWSADWLYNTTKVYAVRIEVKRASILNSNGNYFYTINTWIKRCSSDNISDSTACAKDENNNDINPDFNNTKVAYNPTPVDLPVIKRTIELAPGFHSKFDKFLFGWTAAAGSASRENLALSNFQLYFAREPVACGGYGVWNNVGIAGSTSYFKINGTGCTGILKNSFIGNIGPGGTIKGYTNSTCLPAVATTPSELTYSDAAAYDANMNCAVYFDATDK